MYVPSTTASSANSRIRRIGRTGLGPLPRQYGNIQRLDRILDVENDDVNRYKASKQADVLMLLYLMSATELCELLDRLGYRFIPDQVQKWLTTTGRTSHGRHSAVWCIPGCSPGQPPSCNGVLPTGAKSDVSDIQGGTRRRHSPGGMAGSVDLMQRCFTGWKPGLTASSLPHWPEALAYWHSRSTTAVCTYTCGQRKGVIISVDPRRRRNRSGMPRSSRSTDARTTVRFPG